MADPTLDQVRRVHLVGVGGAGMSALAKLLAGKGFEVSGSDLRASEALTRLAEGGMDVWAGSHPERVGAADVVVASSAVPEGDGELVAARAEGLPVWRRPQLLAALSSRIPTVGPTGTHGKTSTAAMLVVGARAGGADPSFVLGGDLLELRTNAGVGQDDLLVLEVDEAFGTFESVHLRGLVVTNVEPEHLDHFGSVEAMEEAFIRVMSAVDGPLLACADDDGAARAGAATGAISYGTSREADWRIVDPVLGAGSTAFRLVGPGGEAAIELPRPGIHMVRNAAGSLALLAELGFDLEAAAAGLADFRGVRRRFEHKGTVAGVTVVDDYAHHPTEVAATLTAGRRAAEGRLVAVFQPHLFSRTERFHREFGEALAAADVVFVTDVYPSREDPIPGVTGRLVAEATQAAGANEVHYVPHLSQVAEGVALTVQSGDTVVFMGAGDITVVPAELLALLAPDPA